MANYIGGLVVGVTLVAFGLGHASGARGRTWLGSAWIDAAVLAFVGANILLLSVFGLRP